MLLCQTWTLGTSSSLSQTRSTWIAPLAGWAAWAALGVHMSGKDILILFPYDEEVKPCASWVGEEDVAGIPCAGCALAAREAASRGT